MLGIGLGPNPAGNHLQSFQPTVFGLESDVSELHIASMAVVFVKSIYVTMFVVGWSILRLFQNIDIWRRSAKNAKQIRDTPQQRMG